MRQATAQHQVHAPAVNRLEDNAAADEQTEILRLKQFRRKFRRKTKGGGYQYKLVLHEKTNEEGKMEPLSPDLPVMVEVNSFGHSTKFGPGILEKYPTIDGLFSGIMTKIDFIIQMSSYCSISSEISIQFHRRYAFPRSVDIMYSMEECPEYPSWNGSSSRFRVRLSQFAFKDFECPSPVYGTILCTNERYGPYRPVTCGNEDCQYDNICYATNSGYKRRQCSRVTNDGALPSF